MSAIPAVRPLTTSMSDRLAARAVRPFAATIVIAAMLCAPAISVAQRPVPAPAPSRSAPHSADSVGDLPLERSGVTLVAPRDADCPAIVLPFAAASPYATNRRDGLHDGIDFKLPEDTPVLAIAGGKVISVGAGARSAGQYVWLQHAPDDTGLPFWVYTTYRHLDLVAELAVDAVVKVGDVIGLSGPRTYPNLHLATLVSGGDRYEARGRSLVVAGARVVDPAFVYARGLGGLGDLQRRPPVMLGVLIPYAAEDGEIHPARSRMVWPVACKRR